MYVIGLLLVAFFLVFWYAVDKYRAEVAEREESPQYDAYVAQCAREADEEGK